MAGWTHKIFVMNLQFSGRAGINRSLQVHFIMGNQHLLYIPPVGHTSYARHCTSNDAVKYIGKGSSSLQIDVRYITKFIMHKQGKVAAG